MANQQTAVDMFAEMIQQGIFSPALTTEQFELPSMLQAVPTFTTYSTPAAPLTMGVGNAGLEERSSRDSGTSG